MPTTGIFSPVEGMALVSKGRAGAALTIAALGSFFAGCVSTAVVAAFSAPLVVIANTFTSPDYFGLLVFGLIAAGKLKPVIHGVYPLKDFAKAAALTANRDFFGKMVMVP